MFFSGWEVIIRTVVVGVMAYVLLVAMLRTSGKRTLSKMNAFDLVVTVALGSTLATVLLSKDVALAEGATGLLVLIGLQFLVATGAVHSTWLQKIVKSTPRALFVDGKVIDDAAEQERVTRDEIFAAIRAHGLGDLAMVASVVLETDGSFSVIAQAQKGDCSALATVQTSQSREYTRTQIRKNQSPQQESHRATTPQWGHERIGRAVLGAGS